MKPKTLRKHANALELYAQRMIESKWDTEDKELFLIKQGLPADHYKGWKQCYNDVIQTLNQSAYLLRNKASEKELK